MIVFDPRIVKVIAYFIAIEALWSWRDLAPMLFGDDWVKIILASGIVYLVILSILIFIMVRLSRRQ